MILYNVTVSLDPAIEQEWLVWMKQKHIPDVMNTGSFVEYKLLKVLNEEDDGKTYCVQYMAENLDKLHHYNNVFAPALKKEYNDKFQDRFAVFRTVLEVM